MIVALRNWGLIYGLSCLLISSQASAQSISQAVSTKPDSEMVLFSVAVTNRAGDFVGQIKKDDFIVYSDDKQQEISFYRVAAVPVSIVFLIDHSGSMHSQYGRGNKVKLLVDGVVKQIEASNFGDEYSVISFGEDVQLDLGWTKSKAEAAAKLRALTAVQGKGQTAFYDAAIKGVEQALSGTNPLKVLIILSDGEDSLGARNASKKLAELLRCSEVIAYQVNPGCIPFNMLEQQQSNCVFPSETLIKRLITATGGTALRPETMRDIDPAITSVFQHFRLRYFIGFKPEHQIGDNKFHRLRVKAIVPANAPKELRNPVVHHRKGYYWSAIK